MSMVEKQLTGIAICIYLTYGLGWVLTLIRYKYFNKDKRSLIILRHYNNNGNESVYYVIDAVMIVITILSVIITSGLYYGISYTIANIAMFIV